MEHTFGNALQWLIKNVRNSVGKDENRGTFGVSFCTATVAGLHLCDFSISDFWVKAIASVGTVICGPAMATFVSDLYKEKIKPWIFKSKHRY